MTTATVAMPQVRVGQRRKVGTLRERFDIDPDAVRMAPSDEAYRIDAAVCSEATCEECGAVNMTFVPFTTFHNGRMVSYRAIAICKTCGFESEF